jgi:hypothetical protein
MVATVTPRRRRIRFYHLSGHLVGGDLTSDVEEGGKSSGCFSHGVVDLVLYSFVAGLVSGYTE